MKINLEVVYTTQLKPKANYLLFYENSLHKVSEVNGNSITIQEYFTGDKMVGNLDEMSDYFIKFLAKSDKFIQAIIRTDYTKIVSILHKSCSKNGKISNVDFNNLLKGLLEYTESFEIKGTTIRLLSKPKAKDKVEITNINIIDNFELYPKNSRIFIVEDVITKGKNIRYKLKHLNSNINTEASRESFKTLDVLNYKDLFTIEA